MNTPKNCYIGIKPCGCVVAWVNDNPAFRKGVAEAVSEFIQCGYQVEAANTDEVRHKLKRCKCEEPVK